MNSKNDSLTYDELSLKSILLSIKKYYIFLQARWLVIFSVAIFGAIIGFFYAYSKKPTYTSVITFVLDDDKQGSGFGSLSGLASIAGVDLGDGGGGIFRGDNILELYKSRNMIQKALLTKVIVNNQRQLLIDMYIKVNGLRDVWAKQNDLRNISFGVDEHLKNQGNEKVNRLRDSIMGVVISDLNNNYLKVNKPDKKLSIISAQVVSENESFSKLFNEEIVKTVNDFYIQTTTKKSIENVSILQQKVDSVRQIMNNAIYSSTSIADGTANLNPTRQVQRTAPMQKLQFSAETNKLILGDLLRNLELSKIALRKETPLIQIIDSPVFPLQKTKFGKIKGLFIGGIIGGIIMVVVLSIRFLLNNLILD